MSELPGGWSETEIGPVNTYSSETLNPAKAPKQTFELYSVPVFPKRKPEIVDGKDIGSTKQKVEPDDVLLCKINPRINRVWLVGKKNDHEQIASSEWIVIRQPLFHPDFIRFQLQESSFRDRLCAEVSGVGGSLTRAQPKKVESYKLRIAPLAEQKRIAQKLDALLAQVDTLKARIDAIPALLKRFRQSALAQAINGNMTASWRNKSKADKPEEKKFEDLLRDRKHLSYGVLKPGDEDSQGVPMIRVMDLDEHGGIDTSHVYKISKTLSQEFKRTALAENDLVLSVMATIGRVALVPSSMSGGNVNRALAVIKLREDVSPKFVLYLLMSPQFQAAFVEKQLGSAQKRINLSDLREFHVKLPTLPEQAEIVRRVEQLFAYADQLEAKVAVAQQRIDALTQSLLAKAFRGELVPQNPTDEPASVLLERIRAQRAAAPKPKRGRKAATS